MLQDALEFYQRFLKERGTDPAVRLEAARAYLRVGQIHTHLGQITHAQAPLDQAVLLLDSLAQAFPGSPEYRSDLAAAHNDLSTLLALHLLSRPKESLKHALTARAVQNWPRIIPGDPSSKGQPPSSSCGSG